MSEDPRQQELVQLMITAAHAFNLRVVSEGIEQSDTLDRLRSLGCDLAQGYLMGRPMPAGDIPAWLHAWREQRRHQLLSDLDLECVPATRSRP